jgi:hypothetical protein
MGEINPQAVSQCRHTAIDRIKEILHYTGNLRDSTILFSTFSILFPKLQKINSRNIS